MSADEHDQRLVELELKFTEQQALLQELSQVLWSQQKTLDVLREQVEFLRSRLENQPGTVRQYDPGTDKPPHY